LCAVRLSLFLTVDENAIPNEFIYPLDLLSDFIAALSCVPLNLRFLFSKREAGIVQSFWLCSDKVRREG